MVRKKLRFQQGQSRESYDKMVRNEDTCLRFLDRLEHPNIIPLLASYTYCGEHYFLFPAYEMDLGAFLESPSRFGDFKYDFTFYSALRGLASALSSTHNLHLDKKKHGLDIDMIGYHHDLRPANVLISQETFILADFGLGRFKLEGTLSQTPWKAGVGDYLAPECMDEGFNPQDVGRAIDVWAFGCLMIEVATYMDKDVAGLKAFRESRLGGGPCNRWEESRFSDGEKNLKSAVQQWLAAMTNDILLAAPIASLVNLSRKAMKMNPKERPKIADICAELSMISLRAHFIAVHDAFSEHVKSFAAMSTGQESAGTMKLWFEKERLTAFGHISGFDSKKLAHIPSDDLNKRYDEYRRPLVEIFCKLERFSPNSRAAQESYNSIESIAHLNRCLEDDIYNLVESLWSLLPPNQKKMAERAWLQVMLNTENVDRLDDIELTFKIEDDPVYEKGAAMANMKKIRLELQSDPNLIPKDFVISRQDVQDHTDGSGHRLGNFKCQVPVFVEYMSYSPGWEKIPPKQRIAVMARKAQGFSGKTRHAARMRTLDCIGVFENTDEKAGYGFVYQIPVSEAEMKLNPSSTTLLQFFTPLQKDGRQQRQPLLGDKFRLASMLAQFLWDFHSVGWLHENFNSHNILFFDIQNCGTSSRFLSSQALGRPYIVGLHKSRPGGESWYTEGPSSGASAQDYQHPEYCHGERYRAVFDYYSLGLVLLEIGFWRPLRVFWESPEFQGMKTLKKDKFRQALVEHYVPRLGTVVGAVYRNVVDFCLTISTDSREDFDTTAMMKFAEKVVEPLEELAKMPI